MMQDHDRHSDVWARLKSVILKKIEKTRDDLETIGYSQDQTSIARGRIEALRELIAMVEPDAPKDMMENTDYLVR